VNREVEVILRAHDVIHSFFIPSMRFQQEAVPGLAIHRNHFHFAFTGTIHGSRHDVVLGRGISWIESNGGFTASGRIDSAPAFVAQFSIRPGTEVPLKLHAGDLNLHGPRSSRIETLRTAQTAYWPSSSQ